MTSCDRNGNKDEYSKNANFVKTFVGRFGIGQWSIYWDQVLRRSGALPRTVHKEPGQYCGKDGSWNLVSGCPIFCATTPLSRGHLKSKRRGKLSMHFTANQDAIDTIYRIILTVNQLSVCGAMATICEEFKDHQDRTEGSKIYACC